ncbi:probable cytochrome P450 301a1, mitochondrial isoform X2 [Anabrus simplex]|uniref:probable cytochrome P450 301a1, mitochondrial isoform X2 n=1 Tax=Anabrus simplex TaxID=316456 RepID=UPI0035A29F30
MKMTYALKTLRSSHHGASAFIRSSSTVAVDQQTLAKVRPFEEIPGPKPASMLGNLWRYLPFVDNWSNMDFLEQQKHLRAAYGDLVKVSGFPSGSDSVFVFNPEDAQTVFRNEGKWPIRDAVKSLSYYRTVLRKDVYHGIAGIITSQGETWQEFRSKVNQPMMQPRSAKMYVTPINDVAEDFINRIRDFRDNKNEVPRDFINELYKWSLESIATVTLDTRLGCLSPDMKPDSEPQKMIEAVHVTLRGIYELDLRPSLWKYISTPMWRKYVKALDVFTEVSMKYIKEAMDRIESKPADSMLERLLLSSDDPMVACVMAIDMLFGGVDTTSHSTAMFLFNLANNPKKQEVLFQEVKRLLPESRSQPVTMEIFNEMRYLRACLKESMRLNPINFGNLRRNPEDIVLSNYHIPKGIIRNFTLEYNEGDKLTIECRAINTVTSPLNFKMVDRE